MIRTMITYSIARFQLFKELDDKHPEKSFKEIMALVNVDLPLRAKVI